MRNCVTFLFFFLFGAVNGSKILLLPADHTAHVKFFSVIGETLQNSGHQVTLLTFSRQRKYVADFRIPYLYQEVPDDTESFMENQDLMWEAARKGQKNVLNFIQSVTSEMTEKCKLVFGNVKLMSAIKDGNFNLVILDATDMWHCAYILPYKLNLKYISITPLSDPWLARVSPLPSFELHHAFVGIPGTILQSDHIPDLETFSGRLLNLLTFLSFTLIRTYAPFTDNALIGKYAPDKPQTTYRELLRKSEMFFVNVDTWCSDWPRTSAPHYQYIGGLNMATPKAIDGEFGKFLQGADALVIVSFGSALKKMPLYLLVKLLEAFSNIKEQVIMRYDGDIPGDISVPTNVLVSRWLPQNDLLALPITKVFITHGGNNGQMEAIYHGVPLLTMPVFGDQMYNGRRAEAKGYGHVLNPFTFSPPDLVNMLRNILDNSSYSENVNKCAAVLRSAPDPQQVLTFWVNFILLHGGDTLKHPHLDMPLWKFFMIDVLFFIFCVIFLALLIFLVCCCKAYQVCCKPNKFKSKKE